MEMNGYIVARGREMNIPTPVNAATVEIIRQIEANQLESKPENMETILSIAGL